jgi:hypothetical protein
MNNVTKDQILFLIRNKEKIISECLKLINKKTTFEIIFNIRKIEIFDIIYEIMVKEYNYQNSDIDVLYYSFWSNSELSKFNNTDYNRFILQLELLNDYLNQFDLFKDNWIKKYMKNFLNIVEFNHLKIQQI